MPFVLATADYEACKRQRENVCDMKKGPVVVVAAIVVLGHDAKPLITRAKMCTKTDPKWHNTKKTCGAVKRILELQGFWMQRTSPHMEAYEDSRMAATTDPLAVECETIEISDN